MLWLPNFPMPFPSLSFDLSSWQSHLHLATSSRRQRHCDFMSHYCALFATHHQYFFPGLVYIVTLSCVCFSAFLSQVQNLQLSGNSSHSSFSHVCAQSWVELLTYRPTSSFARASNCGHFPTSSGQPPSYCALNRFSIFARKPPFMRPVVSNCLHLSLSTMFPSCFTY